MIIRRSSFLAVMFGAAVFANVPAAQAAITKTHQAQASALMQQGKAAQAYALLRRHHNRASAGPQQWFILGLAAYRARDLNAAEYAFRQVLAKRPNAPRAKLELARVLQQKGDAKNAERLFREVRALNPPARVAANIDRFIALLQNRNQKGHAFRARATVGVGYDSNVNQATRARTVTLFGLPFMLGSDARKKGAVFGFFTGEFDHVYRANRQFAWVTNLSFTARRHLSHKDFDSFTINAATGPVFQPGDRTTFLLPVFVKVSRYENSALPASRRFYSNEFGIAPQLNHALNKMFTLKLAAVFSHRHYFEQQARNTRIIRGSAGFDIKAGPRSVISAGLVAGREAARQSIYSNRTYGATVSWQYAFASNFVAALQASHENITYDRAEAIHGVVRKDRKTSAGVNAIYQSAYLRGDILFSYMHTWNDSNIAIYKYRRHQVSTALRKPF